MTARACTVCGRITTTGSRCPDHPMRWQNGSNRAWRTQRARILARDPLCRHGNCINPSTEVHHLTPGHNRTVDDNQLVGVCHEHNPRGG